MSAQLFLAGGERDPLVVVRSRFWNFNAIGVYDDGVACVIDPGIDPEEIALLRHAVGERVETVVLTHSHHDHIRGWQHFPGARVVMPRTAAEKDAAARERILAAKLEVDRRLGVEDPQFRYPVADEVFEERIELRVGGLELVAWFVPGHSNCTSVVWIPALGTLCTADYLVEPGLPYCRWQAADFENALGELRAFCEREGVERVLPSHNAPILGRREVLAALDLEARYFELLRGAVRAGLAAGTSPEESARRAAAEVGRWRERDVGKRARQDLDNARRVVAEEAPCGDAGARAATPAGIERAGPRRRPRPE